MGSASHADTGILTSLGFSQAASVPPLALLGMVAMSPSASGLQDPILGLWPMGNCGFFFTGRWGCLGHSLGDFMRHCCVGWEQPCLEWVS